MTARRGERGEVSIGCLVGVVVLLIATVIAISWVPRALAVYELENKIESLADRANRIDYKDKKIHEEILEAADELRLNVAPEAVKIKRSRSYIEIRVTYDVIVKFPFYTYIWHRDVITNRPLF